MTFADFQERVFKNWWMIFVVAGIFTLCFIPWSTAKVYQASLTLGVNYNSPEYLSTINNPIDNTGYIASLRDFSGYLDRRFASLEVQVKIAERAGIKISTFSDTKPFYDLQQQGAGYLNVSSSFKTRKEAEAFLDSTKEVYKELVSFELERNRLAPFKVTPNNDFIYVVKESNKPSQIKILPSIAGVLIGLVVVALIPVKKSAEKTVEKKEIPTTTV